MHATRRRGFLRAALGLWLPTTNMNSAAKRQLVRSCLWRRTKGEGLERFELLREDDRWILVGTILAMDDHGPAEARYEVVCDAGWRTVQTQVSLRATTGERSVQLTARDGRWYVNGHEEVAVRGSVDVDLGWSPSTNTLPIRRLGLAGGRSSGPLVMAWIRFPELTIEPLPQEYQHLSERTYRYTSRSGTFAADLEVDDMGVVVNYEGIWRRVEPVP